MRLSLGLLQVSDIVAAVWLAISGPILMFVAKAREKSPVARAVLDRYGVSLVRHHYYEPIVTDRDIVRNLSDERKINGIDLRECDQLDLVKAFSYREELLRFPMNRKDAKPGNYYYNNDFFEFGDSEILYSMVRYFKPRNITEIGCGYSSLMIKAAIDANRLEDPSYVCRHISIEPFENEFLEKSGIEVIRKRVEFCGREVFSNLGNGDILFIDSSHVIRPQGDVLFEYGEIMGMIAPGVIVHVHDIFTPRDYPSEWILGKRFMWNEQYLLEAFLAYNSEFEIILAANWLKHNHFAALSRACPVLEMHPDSEPGSFWFRRRI